MFDSIQALSRSLTRQVEKIVVGKSEQLHLMIAALLAEGHILLDDLPGVGKTTLIKTLSLALGCDFKRVQFTPDLLPSDVLGMNIYDRSTGAFKRVEGPIMTNLLLADEINRAIPRTQAALLEAMEERQITLDGETMMLPRPFLVMATQNPVELESTFRLPAAQLDRFLICLSLGYPEVKEEAAMLRSVGDEIPFQSIEVVAAPNELVQLQQEIRSVKLSDELLDYIIALVSATRTHPLLRSGASPRASRGIYKASKALAAMSGRDFVVPDDIQKLVCPVLCHRLTLNAEARMAEEDSEAIVAELLEKTPVPPDKAHVF